MVILSLLPKVLLAVIVFGGRAHAEEAWSRYLREIATQKNSIAEMAGMNGFEYSHRYLANEENENQKDPIGPLEDQDNKDQDKATPPPELIKSIEQELHAQYRDKNLRNCMEEEMKYMMCNFFSFEEGECEEPFKEMCKCLDIPEKCSNAFLEGIKCAMKANMEEGMKAQQEMREAEEPDIDILCATENETCGECILDAHLDDLDAAIERFFGQFSITHQEKGHDIPEECGDAFNEGVRCAAKIGITGADFDSICEKENEALENCIIAHSTTTTTTTTAKAIATTSSPDTEDISASSSFYVLVVMVMLLIFYLF